MNRSTLVRLIGFPATLLHGDTAVWDRWRWLKARLPRTRDNWSALDVGCGTGAFTIGAARRGYQSIGLSWDSRNQEVAAERALLCHAPNASFEVFDVRALDQRRDFDERFEVIICFENIEHVMDDFRLMRAMSSALKPGGRLLLTAPFFEYISITREDDGPFLKEETGWHVRRGYSEAQLRELAEASGLLVDRFDYVTGFFSQKVSWLWRKATRFGAVGALLATLPLRPLPFLFDRFLAWFLRWPAYSIAMVAVKPRLRPEGHTSVSA